MSRYQPYPTYKDSGVEWLGEVPEHWVIKNAKYVLHDNLGIKIGPFGSALRLDEMVSFGHKVYGQENVINNDFDLGHRFISDAKFKDMIVYKVEPNDILITMMGTIGKCVVVPHDVSNGIIDSHLIKLRVNSLILPEYFEILIDRSNFVKIQLELFSKGSIMQGLNSTIIKSLRLPLPPLSEQITIANFLDRETAKIDTLIEKQQRLIELLKEKRQAIISYAVTKGLKVNSEAREGTLGCDPDVKMKDSGVEWLGEVPEHWILTRAKNVSKVFIPQRNKPVLNNIVGTYWLTMDDMKNPYIISTKNLVSDDEAEKAGSKVLPSSSVIASCVGTFGVTAINKVDVIINQQLQAYIPNKINNDYLRLLISISKSYFEIVGTAATLIFVNREGFENLPVCLPSLEEQEQIVKYLDVQTTQIDTLIEKAKKAIDLLKERRTALISAAVTGKIDVRGEKVWS